MTVVNVKLPHGAAAGTRRARWRRGVCFLELVSDSSQAIVAWPTFTLEVRSTRNFVTMVHAVTEDTVALVKYHTTLLA